MKTNYPERTFLSRLLLLFKPTESLSTIEWAKRYRFISATETSVGVGRFDPLLLPYMEYVYDCLDNPFMPNIGAMKSARIGWTETLNNYRAKTICSDPKNMLLGFPTKEASRTFAKGKWAALLSNTRVLQNIVNVGVSKNKESIFDYTFPSGSLRLVTLGSISSQKSDNIPYIEIEEPDDAADDVNGQGDTLSNLRERQKTIPTTMKKFIFGGTPTNADFSRVEEMMKKSNQLVFKAECHCCGGLIPMDWRSFECISIDDFPLRKVDEIYERKNPESAKFFCPMCGIEWTFEEKNKNIKEGCKHGFIDHTGKFSKGWHPLRPEVTDITGFFFSELLSPFPASSFIEIAKAKVLAEIKLAQGNELLMKSFVNNRMGKPYAAGISGLEVEELRTLRSNYTETLVPAGGILLTAGIDIQHNRFAFCVYAWGREGQGWLVEWKEIFGNVLNGEDSVWLRLSEEMTKKYPTELGGSAPITGIAVDTGDGATTELAYRWIREMSSKNPYVFATKGVRDLSAGSTADGIYAEPVRADIDSFKQERRSLAETFGVTIYKVGAHIAHDEVLRRLTLLKTEGRTDRLYFCETAYGGFEEQIISCRKIWLNGKLVYKLIPGKRKEALDCTKLALWVTYALRIREYSETNWRELERGLEA